MGKKICLLTDHHICVNPRTWKEALFYEKDGYEVTILAMWVSADSLAKDREILNGTNIKYLCYLNLIPGSLPGFKRLFYRVRKRLATELFILTGISTKWTISYAPEKMIAAALAQNANLYAAHLECAFYAGRALIRKGKKVSFDFEDWYSRDYLVPGRPVKLLAMLEGEALAKGIFCTTTSMAMKKALQKAYQHKDVPFEVIYNGFSIKEWNHLIPEKNKTSKPRLLWFSRTVGAGRGIETILQVLQQYPKPVELHLLGNASASYKLELEKQFPFYNQHELFFHDFIPHHSLPAFISTFDIGFAIEEFTGDNKINTISNKMLQYLQFGVKVIATATNGQQEVAAYFPNTVRIVSSDIQTWIAAINELLESGNIWQRKQLETFEEKFSWEAQEEKLKTLTAVL